MRFCLGINYQATTILATENIHPEPLASDEDEQ